MTLEEVDAAVVTNMQDRIALLEQRISSSDIVEREQIRLQIQQNIEAANDLATLRGVIEAAAILQTPPAKDPPPDADVVANLKERATLLQQSITAADKTSRDTLQTQVALNSAKADDIAKLRSIQDQLAKAAAAAASAEVKTVP